MEKPEGYSKAAIEEIAKKYGALPDKAASAAAPEQPNIVYMMDEAFFDPTRMTAFKFSEDPLQFIHQEERKTPSGFLLSPEFGGNTANVEFEALTGLSMYFLKDGSIPYQQKIVKMSSLPSIVSILKDRGYRALALHPFDKTFYNRDGVYKVMGFDKFTGEQDMENAGRITKDGYISDQSAVEEAVRELKASDQPTFLHLVTMQNHFPFTKGVNGPNTVTVEGVQPGEKDELETYVQDAKLTDQALAYLSEQLKTIKRPTVVVFWGDHLPALSAGIYTQAGWDANPKLKHETKLLYMANFDIGQEPVGTQSPAFIGPTVFGLTGQKLPPYYKLLEKVKSEIPGLSKNVLLGSSGTLTKLTAEQQALLHDYKLVEYDMLAGEHYSQNLLF
nr:LTA synthase family protein [Paenibacillus caui]